MPSSTDSTSSRQEVAFSLSYVPPLEGDPALGYRYRDAEGRHDVTGAILAVDSDAGDVLVEQVHFEQATFHDSMLVEFVADQDGAPGIHLENLENWSVLQNIEVTDLAGGALTIDKFLDVRVDLAGETADLDIEARSLKRGEILSGDGDDRISLRPYSNEPFWDNVIRVATGNGSDALDVSAGDPPAGGGNAGPPYYPEEWTIVQADLGNGDDTVRAWQGAAYDVAMGAGVDTAVLHSGSGRFDLGEGDDRSTVHLSGYRPQSYRSLEVNGGAGRDTLALLADDPLAGPVSAPTLVFHKNQTGDTAETADTIEVDPVSQGGLTPDMIEIRLADFGDDLQIALESLSALPDGRTQHLLSVTDGTDLDLIRLVGFEIDELSDLNIVAGPSGVPDPGTIPNDYKIPYQEVHFSLMLAAGDAATQYSYRDGAGSHDVWGREIHLESDGADKDARGIGHSVVERAESAGAMLGNGDLIDVKFGTTFAADELRDRVEMTLTETWGTVPRIDVSYVDAYWLTLKDFADVRIDLQDDLARSIDLWAVKQGEIRLGGGNDQLDIRAWSDAPGEENTIRLFTGDGSDRIQIASALPADPPGGTAPYQQAWTTIEADLGAGNDVLNPALAGTYDVAFGEGDDHLGVGPSRGRFDMDEGDDRAVVHGLGTEADGFGSIEIDGGTGFDSFTFENHRLADGEASDLTLTFHKNDTGATAETADVIEWLPGFVDPAPTPLAADTFGIRLAGYGPEALFEIEQLVDLSDGREQQALRIQDGEDVDMIRFVGFDISEVGDLDILIA